MHRTKLVPLVQRRTAETGALLILALAGGSAVGVAAVAATKPPNTLGIAANVPVGSHDDSIVVNSRGRAVYTLSGESTRRLRCTKANQCFKVWLPVKVASARARLTAARGIKGKLGKLHRNGIYQVTLAGRPLYTFVGDGSRRHSTSGEGIVSFGGTWHVVTVKSGSSQLTTTGSTTTTSSTTSTTSAQPVYPYGY